MVHQNARYTKKLSFYSCWNFALGFLQRDIQVACVVGVPDSIAGELPAALIILHENAEISAEEIEEMVAGKV